MCTCVWQADGRPQTDSRCHFVYVCVCGCVPPSCLDLGKKQTEEKKEQNKFRCLVNHVIKMSHTHTHCGEGIGKEHMHIHSKRKTYTQQIHVANTEI